MLMVRARVGWLVAGLITGGAALQGCQHVTTYPNETSARGVTENPNTPACEQAMIASVQYVASRWTPGKREYDENATPGGAPMVPYDMIVNLPIGTRKMFYDRIPAQIGPNVKPVTPESVQTGLPVFHVARVWLRFNSGTIDVLRPATELGAGPDGKPIYQKITLTLKREFNTTWRVVYGRTWNPGDDTPPDLYYVPAEDDPNQYALCMQAMRQTSAAALDTPHNSNEVVPDTEPTLGAAPDGQ
ncbi:MAG: hypothetical protein U0637_00550 [Phycisphaerales bacterium]